MIAVPPKEKKDVRIGIAGGGPGGLFAGLVLAHDGHEVTLFEQSAALATTGAGIQLSPNGTRLLAQYDVLDDVRAVGFVPQAAVLRRAGSGQVVLRTPLETDADERYGAPYLHVHRADLSEVLLAGVRANGVDVRWGTRVGGYDVGARGVSVALEGKSSEAFDVLIGADGIHSAVRMQMQGAEEARFTGHVAWRGLVPATDELRRLIKPNATVWAGSGRHFVHYYVRGGALINFVAVEERDSWVEENWQTSGDIRDVRSAFDGWSEGITALLFAADACHLWGLFDRPPLTLWSDGPVALLGDACHPMLPFMAQGAVMAFEDAVVLSRALSSSSDVPAALAGYERVRKSRTTRVQARARRNGCLFHQKSGLIRALTLTTMGIAGKITPDLISRQLDWIYSHDAAAVDDA